MTTITLSNNPSVSSWQTATNNTSVNSNIAGVTLTGISAAAYLFGQAIRTVDGDSFGQAGQLRVSRSKAAFEFPAGSGLKVSLTEISDALKYKFGCDSLIEYSSDVGVNGYSVADINLILQRLNDEYQGQFSLEPLTLRDLSSTMVPIAVMEGRSSDILLRDELTSAQTQALVNFAKQLKIFAQSWLDTLGAPTDPLASLLRAGHLDNGLALTATSTMAVPGETLSVNAVIGRAGQALGIDFSSRFPDLFADNKLRIQDVNLLLAAAREASPSLANDLADLVPIQGLSREGVSYTARRALLVHSADVLAGLTLTSGTAAPRIGWNDAVFRDPFGGANLSANQLKARLLPTGFDPFAYLGSPLPDYLTLSDLNAFLAEANTELGLAGISAYAAITFQFKDSLNNNITPRQAYLNQVMLGLASAGSSASLSGVWSPDYNIGSFFNAPFLPTGQFWQLSSLANGYTQYSEPFNNGTPNLQDAILATVSGAPTLDTIYLRRTTNLANGQQQLAGYRWNGATFDPVTQVNGLTLSDANLQDIGDYWKSQNITVNGLLRVSQINLEDYSNPSATEGSPAQLISATELGQVAPYFSAMNLVDGGGIQSGEWMLDVNGAKGYSQLANWATIQAAMIADGPDGTYMGSSFQRVYTFQAPSVESTEYFDLQGNEVQNLEAGMQYRAVVKLTSPWPNAAGVVQALPSVSDLSGFLNALQWAQYNEANNSSLQTGITLEWKRGPVTPSNTWGAVGADGVAVETYFTATANGEAEGTVKVGIASDQWWRANFPGRAITDSPMMDDMGGMLTTNVNDASPFVGWTGRNPYNRLSNSLGLTAPLFEYPPGSGARITLAQLSQALARDYLGTASAGNDGDGALDLVDWFMGKGAAYSGTTQGWPSQYDNVGHAALAYQSTPGTLPVVGLGAWNDPTGVKPLSEWSIKAGLFSLWWNFYLVGQQGDGTAGTAVPAGLQPVASGPAQIGVVASAALSAKTLALPLAGVSQLVGSLTNQQRAVFHQESINRSLDAGGTNTDQLAEFRRAFKGSTQASMVVADFSGLPSSTQRQMVSAAKGIEAGLMDSSVLNRLAFGQRIGFDEPLFFNAQGEPASLNSLLGGGNSALALRIKAVIPGLVDLGLNFDDLRRVITSAAALDTSIVPANMNDPAREPVTVDGVDYRGGSATLLRIAASIQSLAVGAHASVPLRADERVFADPIQMGSGVKWSLNDLALLASRSAGYTAMTPRADVYDTDLDAMVRQLELVAGKQSAVSLNSTAVPDAVLSWFTKQLVVPGGAAQLLLSDANAATFGTAGSTKSFMSLLADAQRLFGVELAPRFESLGVLQGGALRNVLNVAALNKFIEWEKGRDPSIATTLMSVTGTSTATLSLTNYTSATNSIQAGIREVKALQSLLQPWVPPAATATEAQWRMTQQRLAALIASLGGTSRAMMTTSGLDMLKALAKSTSSPTAVASLATNTLTAVTSWSEGFQTDLESLGSSLDLSALPITSVMSHWTFGQDQSTVINNQQALVANFDAVQAVNLQALQQITVGNGGSVHPDATATSVSGKSLRGSQALATLLAQSFAGLDADGQALASIDPDALLFVDPSAPSSKAFRDMSTGSNIASKVSLRQLGSWFQTVLGFNVFTDYAPSSGPWTVARLNGVIKLVNDALGLTAANLYSVTPLAVGSAQTLRDKIVRADTQELVIPKDLRAPLATMLNHLGELSASDMDANGFINTSANLFDSTAARQTPDLSFNQIIQAGNVANPTLADLLRRMGILVGNVANVRGLNKLLDVARAEMPDLVTATPLTLPNSVLVQEAAAHLSLDDFEIFINANTDSQGVLDKIQSLVDEWKGRDMIARIADAEWQPWKDRLGAVITDADAKGIAVSPELRTQVQAVQGLTEAMTAWTPPETWLGTLATRIQAVIDDINLSISQATANKALPAYSGIPSLFDNYTNALKNQVLIPFTAAKASVDSLLAKLDADIPFANAIAQEKIRLATNVVDWQGSSNFDGNGAPKLTVTNSLQIANPASASFDLLDWLHTFDMPGDWLNNPSNRDGGDIYSANGQPRVGVWINSYPGAQVYSDSMVGNTGSIAIFNDFEQALATAKTNLVIDPNQGQPVFTWQELAERLMLRSRTVDVPPGIEGSWFQLAHILQNVDPEDLPDDGSGASDALFEFPIGSGQRHSLNSLRTLMSERTNLLSDLPSVNREANTALFNIIDAGGSYTNLADRLKAKIAELKANGSATGDVLKQLTGGVFVDDDVDRTLTNRNRPVDDANSVDHLTYLRALLETNSITRTRMHELAQEFLTRFNAIYGQSGKTDSERLVAVRSLLEGMQGRPTEHEGFRDDFTISDFLVVATKGVFNKADVFWPTDAWSDKPLTSAANRTELIAALQTYVDDYTPPVEYDMLDLLSDDINFTRFTATDRNTLLAAIYQAIPDVAKAMQGYPRPDISPGEQVTVNRLAAKVRAAVGSLATDAVTYAETIKTSAELREDLTQSPDIYVNRNGAYYINGVRTRAMDMVVVGRYLAHDDLAGQYKTLLDGLNQRNNDISTARDMLATLDAINAGTATVPTNSLTTAVQRIVGVSILSNNWDNSGAKTAVKNELLSYGTTAGLTDLLSVMSDGQYRMADWDTYTWNSTFRNDLLARGKTLLERETLRATVESWNLKNGKDMLSALTSGQYESAALGVTTVSIAAQKAYLGTVFDNATALKRSLDTQKTDAQARLSRYQVLKINLTGTDSAATLFRETTGLNGNSFDAAISAATNSINTLTSQLTEVNNGLTALTSLKTAAANGGAAMTAAIAAAKTTYNKSNLLEWLKTFDVPPARQFDHPQNTITVTQTISSTVNLVSDLVIAPAGHHTYEANIAWSDDLMGMGVNALTFPIKLRLANVQGEEVRLVGAGQSLTLTEEQLQLFSPRPKQLLSLVLNKLVTAETENLFGGFNWADWKAGTGPSSATVQGSNTSYSALVGAATGYADADFTQVTTNFIKVSDKYTDLKNLLNTLISNKVRDGDLDQSKLQSITSQLQNNIEAMTALIKAFTELNTTLAQALK